MPNPHPPQQGPQTVEELLLNPPTIVTQTMLGFYERLKTCETHRRELREIILGLLDTGASIEPGLLIVRVNEVTSRQFSGPKLANLLGEERVEELREQIEPTVMRYLRVQRSSLSRQQTGLMRTPAAYVQSSD